MTALIEFQTSMFDILNETENPSNQIYGQSILIWMSENFSTCTFPDAPESEDWGWYTYALWNGRRYMIGASAFDEDSILVPCIVQINKERTIKEKLLGREKLQKQDGLVELILTALMDEPDIHDVVLRWQK